MHEQHVRSHLTVLRSALTKKGLKLGSIFLDDQPGEAEFSEVP